MSGGSDRKFQKIWNNRFDYFLRNENEDGEASQETIKYSTLEMKNYV